MTNVTSNTTQSVHTSSSIGTQVAVVVALSSGEEVIEFFLSLFSAFIP